VKRFLVASQLVLSLGAVSAISEAAHAAPIVADRAVVRFSDPEASETKGALRFVMMRELVVEAWLVAFERSPTGTPSIDDKTLRVALERHIVEAVVGSRVLPPAVEMRVNKAIADVKLAQTVAVGGPARLDEAIAHATGGAATKVTDEELATIFRRRARAELYLELATGQLIDPNEAELRAVHLKAPGAYAKQPFEEVAPAIRAYLRTLRLRESAQSYYQAVRSKLRLEIISET
jgi:hypothetical protein